MEIAQDGVLWGTEGLPDLREHIQGVLVTGVVKRPVTCRLSADEATT